MPTKGAVNDMAKTNKEYELAIKIAGKIDPSLGASAKKAASTLSKLGGAVGTMAKAAGIAIGAATTAAVAFAKSAVDAGMQFDSAMSQVAATMGTTVDQIDQLRDFAMEMGSKTAFSASEAAEALNFMALAGYDAQTSMAMLPNVLNLAAAGTMELKDASDMITDAQSALGLSLEQTSAMVDQMARASSRTNTSVSQLGEAILTVGGTAQYMAGGTNELSTVLGVLADNGIKGSEGGTHLRNMLLKLSSPTADATKLLNRLGVQVFDAEGNMRSFTEVFPELNAAMADMTDQERLDAMATLFNSRDIASATALLGTTTERWEELTAAIEDSAGAAEQMANTQLDNLAGDITLWKSALEGAQITLSDQLTPTLRQFVQFGTSGITQLSDAFKEGGLSGAMEAFGSILSDGLNMVIAALPEMVDAGMQLLGALGEGIIANLPVLTDAVVEIVLMFVDGIAKALPQIAAALPVILATLANGIADALPELIPVLVESFLQIFDALLDPRTFDTLLNGTIQLAVGLVNGVIEALPSIVARIPAYLAYLSGALLSDAAFRAMPAVIEAIKSVLLQLKDVMVELLRPIADEMTAAFGLAWEAIKYIFAPVGEFFSGVWSGIKGAFGAVTDWFSGVFTDAWTAVKDVFSKGGEIFTGIVDGILDGFKVVVNGIIGGLNAVIKVPFNGINTALRTIRDINILGVTPFSWITEIGVPQIPMLAEGGVVNQATTLIAGEAGSEAIVPLSELWAQLQDMISDSIGGASDRIADLLTELDGTGSEGEAEQHDSSGVMYQITYSPENHYHFDSSAPSSEDIAGAERMSQDEFNRKMAQWMKDAARKGFSPVMA